MTANVQLHQRQLQVNDSINSKPFKNHLKFTCVRPFHSTCINETLNGIWAKTLLLLTTMATVDLYCLLCYFMQDGLLSSGYGDLITRIHKQIPQITPDGKRLQMIVCSATLHSFDVKKMAVCHVWFTSTSSLLALANLLIATTFLYSAGGLIP